MRTGIHVGEPIEERMMAEYAASRLTPGTWKSHVRLGRVPEVLEGRALTVQEQAAMKVTLPEADLVVRGPSSTQATIVEFVVWRPVDTVGQLVFYRTQLPLTPGYEDVVDVRLKIVTGIREPRLEALAGEMGILLEEYRPSWLDRELARRRGRR